MTELTGRRLLVVTFLVVVAMVTWSELRDFHVVPRPQRYVGAGVAYGLLGIVGPLIGYPLAGMFGVGLLLALVYRHFTPVGATVGGAAGSAAGGVNPSGEASQNTSQE